MPKATLKDNGRLTLPKDVLPVLGWSPGTRLKMTITAEGEIALVPYPKRPKAVRA